MVSEIKKYLSTISEDLREEIEKGKKISIFYLPQISRDDLVLSKTFLLSADLGNFDFDMLRRVAVGLELLNLAVRCHYADLSADRHGLPAGRHGKIIDFNTSLILGDYFYARAISLGAETGESRVVKIMVEAIADISEAQTSKSYRNRKWLGKLSSLFGASCYLGGILSRLSQEQVQALKIYGKNLGCAMLTYSWGIEEVDPKDFIILAKQALKVFPENNSRASLEELADRLIK
ncbi:MAG: polyprenyl synthetase family protein [Candidatus Subteraquimicrobiales bacterium]|nr:polyprenyl synthetase family protein [Candidatus Subteraquimicrobiales bacterium]